MRALAFSAALLATLSVAGASLGAAAPAGGPTWSVGGKNAAYWLGRNERPGPDSEPVEPFRIVGNVYYIGARNIASLLVATPQGHVLMDTGMTGMGAQIIPNIVKLGFNPAEVRILLISHAHMDHVQTAELHRKATGAAFLALEAEVPALSSGHDMSSNDSEGFEPVRIDKVIKDGDSFTIGGTTITTIWTPGHTPGTATYVIDTVENGRPVQVVYGGPPTPVAGNPRHNTREADARTAYQRLKALNPDIVIGGHPQGDFEGKIEAMRTGTRPHPLQLAPGAWAKEIADSEAAYNRRLAAARAAPAAAPR